MKICSSQKDSQALGETCTIFHMALIICSKWTVVVLCKGVSEFLQHKFQEKAVHPRGHQMTAPELMLSAAVQPHR